MNKKSLKRVICVLLSVLTVFSLPLSAFALTYESTPIIYIGGISDNPLYENPNKNGATLVFDINSSDFTGDMTTIVSGVAISMFTDVATGTTAVLNGIRSIMDPILCAPNGESVNSNIGPWEYLGPISEHKADAVYDENITALVNAAAGKVSENEIFFFSYDFRLDPLANALKLKEYIDYVEVYTGSEKVSVLAVGYGGVVANAYLYGYEDHAAKNLESCIFYNCPILGNAIIGDFMKGRIARVVADEDSLSGIVGTINGTARGEAFFNFIEDDATGLINGIFANLLGDSDVTSLFGKLFTLLITTIVEAEDGHKTLGKTYNQFALNADSVIYADCLREYLRNIPGLWALVPEKDFNEAVDFLFEDEFINAELNLKITDYRAAKLKTDATLKKAQQNGINVCIVANYGFQLLPVTISLDDMSDGIESVKYASAGAVTLDNSKEDGHFNNCINAKHNHVSPDKDIDASYGSLPENTWYIKGLSHADISNPTVAEFVVWLVTSDTQRYVRENANYTQYLKYSTYTKKIAPYTTPGDEYSTTKYGDVDYSGDVTAADARLVLRMSVGLEAASKETKIIADVDGDSKVSAADARLVLRYAVGLINNFPI